MKMLKINTGNDKYTLLNPEAIVAVDCSMWVSSEDNKEYRSYTIWMKGGKTVLCKQGDFGEYVDFEIKA